ncbi:BQ2448_7800 [Microbotryum intermedium]|uniref:BQ2448_7800 protein n=1 Tax=Microbotryum intermedium TaxID=269621 RepID=A0A238FRD0_9BASI|nr:BQ2448_7800 [Microbotryum intermedium]
MVPPHDTKPDYRQDFYFDSSPTWAIPYVEEGPHASSPFADACKERSSGLTFFPSGATTSEPYRKLENPTSKSHVDELAKYMEFLSFLKERRDETPVIKLPIPISSSAAAHGVVGEPAKISSGGRRSSNARTSIDGRQGPRAQRLREEAWTCSGCHKDLGRMLLRDPASAPATPYRSLFLCTECCPSSTDDVKDSDSEGDKPGDGAGSGGVKASYFNSWSSRLDREMSQPIPLRPTAGRVKLKKKRREMDSMTSPCDVCTRIIASGTISAIDRDDAPPELLVEFVCASCYDRYQRCTDCGSRFSPRVGTGKWRVKELFADGKRSCSLPHRTFILEDTTYDTWRVSDLPHGSEEFEAFLHEAHKALVAACMSVIAIPDTMESESSLCIDFRTAAIVTNDIHHAHTTLLKEDVEEELGHRRFLALRWQNPNKSARDHLFAPQSQDVDTIAKERPKQLF